MKQNQIQAIVSVLSTEVSGLSVPSHMHLHIPLDDMPAAPLEKYFTDAIRFIHEHRMENREFFKERKIRFYRVSKKLSILILMQNL